MDTIKILILEDDPLLSLRLERLVDELGYLPIVTDNSDTALKMLSEIPPHLGLLDISVPGSMDGVELSEHFKKKGIPFIILTGFTDRKTFIRARQKEPFIFLTKPVHLETLQSAIESALVNAPSRFKKDDLLSTAKKVFIRTNDKLEIVDISTIEMVEANGNYCDVFITDGRKLTVKSSLKKISQKLSRPEFVQVHRSFIVQLDCIKNIFIAKNYLTVGEKQIPLGDKYKTHLLGNFNAL